MADPAPNSSQAPAPTPGGREHVHEDRQAHGHAHGHAHPHPHPHANEPGHGHGSGHRQGFGKWFDHGHSHGAVPDQMGPAFALAIGLNIAFVAVEFGYGVVAHSTALIADAGHNASDVLSLVVAWVAIVLGRRAPSLRYTYGLRKSSILAALANALLLLLACGAIGWEALSRLMQPGPVNSPLVMAVAAAGIVVNGVSALLFAKGRRSDINVRGAYLHMLGDAAVSAGVVVAGGLIWWTGWTWLDPAISLAIVAFMVLASWGLLRDSMQLALGGVPPQVDVPGIQSYLLGLPGVSSSHDLHIWGLSTTETALTVHLVTPGGHPGDGFIDEVTRTLAERFAIHHSTLQLEMGSTDHACALMTPRSPVPAAAGHPHRH